MAYPQQSMYDVGPTPGEFLTDMALQASLNFLQRAVLAPTYRMTVLTAVEGELKRQKRLGNEGFGGIWGIARRVYGKEGKLAFFRGLLTDAVLSVPSAITEELSTSLVSSIAFSVFTEERIQSLPSVVVITISLLSTSFAVLLASPVSGIQSTISTNYIADIVAPQPKAAPESAAGRAGAASGPEGCAAALSDAVEDTTEQSETVCPSQEGNKETETYHYANSRETARDIKQRNGWRGFYRGVGLDAVAVFVYRGTYYYTLRALPEWFQEAYPYGIARTLALAAGVITQPLEVISRRMMLTASAPGDSGYRNMIDCARTIISEEGYSGLWSGLKMRLLITGVGIVAMELRNIF